MTPAYFKPVYSIGLGVVLLFALVLSPLRHLLESGMSLHMLAQYPALMLAGALIAAAVPARLRCCLSAWNAMGISGLAAFGLIVSVLMIPRALDLAVIDYRAESVKVAALLVAGAVLRPSWRRAGVVVQGFFLGNVLPMTIVVGTLYQDSLLRLCNAYRLEDQQQLGFALVWGAGVVATVWLVHVMWRLNGSLAMSRQRAIRGSVDNQSSV